MSRMSKTDYIPLLNNYLRRNYQEQFIQKNNFDRYNHLEKNRIKLESILHPLDKSMVAWLLKNRYLFNRVTSVKKVEKKEKTLESATKEEDAKEKEVQRREAEKVMIQK